jgi:Flp pilus assembly secretin CpaC
MYSGKMFMNNVYRWRFNSVYLVFCLAGIVSISGCGDFFASKPTEIESRNILRELAHVDLAPKTQLFEPEFYKKKARIVEGKIGDKTDARLYYFTKHHTADKLASLINTQFIKKFFNTKGQPYPVLDYSVSPNASTNQLIVRCPSVSDAEQVLEFLEIADTPPTQVRIDCLISEVYADHTMDWETTLQIDNLLGEEISLGGKQDGGSLLPAFPGAALRDVARASFGLKAGYVSNDGGAGHEFRALVDLLVSRGYLKILMNPTLEVLNGQTAMIETSEHMPLDRISNVHPVSGVITQSTNYQDIVDSLKVTPYVFTDGYIGLKTEAVIGSKATPEGVKQVPIITTRKINNTENRIRQGESLVIGGITKTEKRSVVRGVPFLKDIPLIGALFSSKDFEERGKEVLFILTPTISSYGIPNKKMVEELREKHETIKQKKTLVEKITDPFGRSDYTDLVEEEATQSEIRRVEARMESSHSKRQIEMLTEELERANARKKDAEEEAAMSKRLAEAAKKVALEAMKARDSIKIDDPPYPEPAPVKK